MRRKFSSFALLMMVVLLLQMLAANIVLADDASDVLTLVNQARASQGLNPVVLCAPLNQAALGHSTDMATRNFFSHTAPPPNASNPGMRITAAGYSWRSYGENIAAGQTTAQQVMNDWMGSSGHRANILNANFVHMGLGTATGNGRKYWTQVFASGGSCGTMPTRTPLPTSTPTRPTNTPTPRPPTNTPVPTSTPTRPTNTPTPRPPTNTAVPSNTPTRPTNTVVPSNTPVPATNTPLPTNTVVPTSTVIPSSSTPLPTFTLVAASSTPTSTSIPASPTLPPAGPSLVVNVSPASANTGATVNVALNLVGVSNLYGLQVECAVDPSVLTGSTLTGSDAFNNNNSFVVNGGYQSDGRWLVAATRLLPNPAINGDALAFTLTYTVQSGGATAVTCETIAADQNGQEIALTVVNGSFNGIPATNTPQPTVVPSLEPTATVTPSLTFTPIPTGSKSSISGSVAYQSRSEQSGINVTLQRADGSIAAALVTGMDGRYTFTDVPVGQYTLALEGAEHLTANKAVNVAADGQTVETGNVVLRAGDTDANQLIDLADAAFVGANFGNPQPPAPTQADLNRDGKIDIRDLVLVGGNFGLIGPIIVP